MPSARASAGRVHLHAPDVALRGLILRVDRERQRFDGGEVQVGHLLHVPLLILDAAHVDLVGPVDQIRRRRGEQRHPVAAALDDRRGHRGRDRADEVARRAPQEVLVPDAAIDCRVDRPMAVAMSSVLQMK